MTKEDAKKIITEAIADNRVVDVSEDYMEGFNAGAELTATLIKQRLETKDYDAVTAILNEPPTLS